MKALWKNAMVQRVGILFLVIFSINSLCTSALGALSAMDWETASVQTKWQVVIAIVGNWTAVLLAFFRDALARIFKGELPLPSSESVARTGETPPPFPLSDRSGRADPFEKSP